MSIHNVQTLDDTATDEQLQQLEQSLRDILDVHEVWTVVERKAADRAYDLLQEWGHDGSDTVNDHLHEYVYDLYCIRVDVLQQNGIIPHTEGFAHDVVSEVVHELADQMMDDVAITEQDIHIHKSNTRTEPDPDRLYEQQLDI